MHESARRIHAALTPQARRLATVELPVQDVNRLLADCERMEATLASPAALAELLATMLRCERVSRPERDVIAHCAEAIVGACAAD